MGHSLIRQKLNRFDVMHNLYRNKSYDLQKIVFQSDYAYEYDFILLFIFKNSIFFRSSTNFQGLNSIFVGLIDDLAWKFGSFGFELQNTLFQIANKDGSSQIAVDLLATNINRGRDHGLKPYIYYVKSCLNITIRSFADLRVLMNGFSITALQAVYEYFKIFYLIIEIYSFFIQVYL
jgi:hypothetical protein